MLPGHERDSGEEGEGGGTGGAHVSEAFGDIPALLPEELERAKERPDHREDDVDDGEQNADRSETVLIEEEVKQPDDAEEDDPAIDGTEDGVEDEGGGAFGVGGHLGFEAKEILLEVASEELAAFGHEVGYFEGVGEEVIAIITHEGIGIEEEGGDGAGDHDVEGDLIEEAIGRRVEPDESGEGGDDEFRDDSASVDPESRGAGGNHPGVAGVAIEAGGDDEEHDAHVGDFRAEVFGGEAMAELVEDFGDDEDAVEDEEVLPTEEVVGEIDEAVGVEEDVVEGEGDEEEGGKTGGGAVDEFADGFVEEGEKAVGVEEGELEKEEVLCEFLKAFSFGGDALFGEPFGVAETFANEEVGFVEHADEAEDVLDGEAGGGELLLEGGEEVTGVFVAVELGDEEMLDGLEAEVAEGGGVFDDETELAVEELGGDEHVGAEFGYGAIGGLGSDCDAIFFVFLAGHECSKLKAKKLKVQKRFRRRGSFSGYGEGLVAIG